MGDSGSCCGYYDNGLVWDFGICLSTKTERTVSICYAFLQLFPVSLPPFGFSSIYFVFQNQPIVEKVWGRFLKSTDTSVASAVGPSVTTSSTDFSFQNLVFGNLFELSVAEIT